MLLNDWIIKDNELMLLTKGGQAGRVSADFVYKAMGDGLDDKSIADPRSDLPNIRFSKVAATYQFEVSFAGDEFLLSPKILRAGRIYSCQALELPLPEHIVLDDVWFYISGGVDEINQVLRDAAITDFGPISLTQYYTLVRYASTTGIFTINSDLIKDMAALPASNSANLPPLLNAKLYPYQETGYRWLSYMAKQTSGCVLGDEMGLGKTLQVITFLLARHDSGAGPSLVIGPVSLLENWKREIEKFAPTLSVLVHQGAMRSGRASYLATFDVVVISYGTSYSDLGMLKMVDWDTLVLDEAQAIKNPDSQRTKTVKEIPHKFGIAVSGTPFENHILDVWSILNFAEPLLLGSQKDFQQAFPDDVDGAERLERVITPFILRRCVDEVATDLPERIDIPVTLTLTESESEIYKAIRLETQASVGDSAATLAALTKLRMFCTHPYVSSPDDVQDLLSNGSSPSAVSAKYDYLCNLLEEIILRGEKVLIFTSYRRMFSIFAADLVNRFGVPVLQIDGSTAPSERQAVVDEFTEINGSAVLVLNPTAAGTGLNITAATNVIHYNLEWNPAKEDQATARAYRRGQTKTVRVYRLFYANTVEEVILERMELKRDMADSAIVGTSGTVNDSELILQALEATPN